MQRPTARHEESLNWRSALGPLEMGNAMKRETERLWKSKGMEDTRTAWFSESAKQGTHEFTETEVAITEPAWVDSRSSA